ncbi:MAG TPA: SDR family NAD(P)-dependent oxidoreductase [Gammaproteobacteria bacterium]|nr:SDR family NAD(P)-dependent oxidoreductase [Gammaproteobacteria bacterium]
MTSQSGAPRVPGLESRAVLVTGAGQGIGAAVACGFAASGARMLFHCNRSVDTVGELAESIVADGGEAAVHQGDLTRPGEAQRTVEADDGVGAFLYLASPALSAYVTGQVIEVDGGQLLA